MGSNPRGGANSLANGKTTTARRLLKGAFLLLQKIAKCGIIRSDTHEGR